MWSVVIWVGQVANNLTLPAQSLQFSEIPLLPLKNNGSLIIIITLHVLLDVKRDVAIRLRSIEHDPDLKLNTFDLNTK